MSLYVLLFELDWGMLKPYVMPGVVFKSVMCAHLERNKIPVNSFKNKSCPRILDIF